MRFAVLSLLALAAGAAHADDAGVTPYRPSVSSPAGLSAVGQLELEFGGLSVKTDGQRRSSTPYLLKLALNDEWAVLAGGEAYVKDGDARGLGDTVFVAKRAFNIDKDTAFGLELGAKVPTARDAIGSGKADYSVNTIWSQDFGAVHMDANLNALRLGATGASEGRVQTGYSASFSTPLNDQWGLTWEWSGTRRSGSGSTSQALAALSYSPSKRMTIDAGVAKGLHSASAGLAVFTGLVVPLAKVF